MTDARTEILARVRRALVDVPDGEAPADVAVTRDYRRAGDASTAELLERFADRVRDYHATVRRVGADVAMAIDETCRELGLGRIGVPPALPDDWRPGRVELVEDRHLTPEELDGLDGVVTGCAAAIAETGTIVLDGQGASGRRALTLLPDHHICVVAAAQVVGLVPEGIARVAPAVAEHGLPITLVSGPSATSDIELTRVEGVHGPRHLVVLLLDASAPG